MRGFYEMLEVINDFTDALIFQAVGELQPEWRCRPTGSGLTGIKMTIGFYHSVRVIPSWVLQQLGPVGWVNFQQAFLFEYIEWLTVEEIVYPQQLGPEEIPEVTDETRKRWAKALDTTPTDTGMDSGSGISTEELIEIIGEATKEWDQVKEEL